MADFDNNMDGNMAKADLYKLASYAKKLFEQLEGSENLEPWVESKVSKAADNIASVYHYLEYETKFNDYSRYLNESSMDAEKKAHALSVLSEAKAKMKELKKSQAAKMTKEGKEHDSKDSFDSSDNEGDTYKTKTGHKATKTKQGARYEKQFPDSYKGHGNSPDKDLDESMTEPCSHCGGAGHVAKQHPRDRAHPSVVAKAEAYHTKMKATQAAIKRMNKSSEDELIPEGKKKSLKENMSPAELAHHHASEYAKHHKAGNLELCQHHKAECMKHGGKIQHGAMGECYHSHPAIKGGTMYECDAPTTSVVPTAPMSPMGEAKKAKKDYDGDGKIESNKDEVWGSRAKAAAKAGKPFNEDVQSQLDMLMKAYNDAKAKGDQKAMTQFAADYQKLKSQSDTATVKEGKPSAGLSKAKKSATVKKAKAGGDIGKPGKGFAKLAKKAGGGEKGEKIAAAAMWKNIKETTAYIEEKNAALNEWGVTGITQDNPLHANGSFGMDIEGSPEVKAIVAQMKPTDYVEMNAFKSRFPSPEKYEDPKNYWNVMTGHRQNDMFNYVQRYNRDNNNLSVGQWLQKAKNFVGSKISGQPAQPVSYDAARYDQNNSANNPFTGGSATRPETNFPVKESTDFARMKEQMARLNRAETTQINESSEADKIRALTKKLLG